MVPCPSLLPGQGISYLLLCRICSPRLGEKLAALFLVLFHPQKTVTCLCGCLESMVKHSKEQQLRLSASFACPYLLLMNPCSLAPAGSFVFEEDLFKMYSRKGSILFWCDPGDSYIMLSTPWPVSSLFPGAHAMAFLWQESGTSKTSEYELHMLLAILSSS